MDNLEIRISQLELRLSVAIDIIAERLAKAQNMPEVEKEFILKEIDQKVATLGKH
jgi:hypothetical protein